MCVGCVLDVCLFAFVCSCDPEHTLTTRLFFDLELVCSIWKYRHRTLQLFHPQLFNSSILPFFHSLILPTLPLNVAPYTLLVPVMQEERAAWDQFFDAAFSEDGSKGSPDTFDDGKGNGGGNSGGNGSGRDPRHALRVTGTPLRTPSKLQDGPLKWGGSVTER